VWSEVRRRRHFLAAEWSRRRRVLFVEPPVSVPRMLAGRLDPPQREMKSASHILKPPRKVAENIFAVTPVKPFFDSAPGLRKLNSLIFRRTVRSAVEYLKFDRPVLWITPEYGVKLLNSVPHSVSVYDVTDDWTQAGIPDAQKRRIAVDDRALLRRADIVFVVSPRLLELKRTARPDAILMPNGVLPEMYEAAEGSPEPDDLRHAPPPRAGYTGTLHEDRLDIGLICGLAERGRGRYSLVLVGPNLLTPAALDSLRRYKNIFIVPAQPFDRLPAFTANFDVCMIPHLLTPFTHSLDPIKAYEYLASGRPIVSTPVDGILPLKEYIALADGADGFHAAIESALAGRGVSDTSARRAAARENSWANRAREIECVIHNFS
jgi:glycosyltransferase involved in cell wall biosynthesis